MAGSSPQVEDKTVVDTEDGDDIARGAVSMTSGVAATATASATSAALNLWGFASRLVDDAKKNADSFVSTIVETDWKHELETIQDTLTEDTAAITHAATSAAASVRDKNQEAAAGSSSTAFSFVTLGQSIVTGTTDWFEQVKKSVDDEIQLASASGKKATRSQPRKSKVDTKSKYNRLDSEISSMQRNSSTYCDEPEDTAAYNEFLASFDMTAKAADIADIMKDNSFMSELHSRIVPLIVEHDAFWQRYFFRFSQLQKQHELRQQLIARTQDTKESQDYIGWDDTSPRSTPESPSNPTRSPGQPLPTTQQTVEVDSESASRAAEDAHERVTGDGGAGEDGGGDSKAESGSHVALDDDSQYDSQLPRGPSSNKALDSTATSDWSMVSGQNSPPEHTTLTSATDMGGQSAEAGDESLEPSNAGPNDAELDVVDESLDLDSVEDDTGDVEKKGSAQVAGEDIDDDWAEWE